MSLYWQLKEEEEKEENHKAQLLKEKQYWEKIFGVVSSDSRYIPSRVKEEVWIRDGGKCVLCGSKMSLEWDHDIPFSLGGGNTANNIRILCKTCNRKKSGKIE
jgi:hypothetical protein